MAAQLDGRHALVTGGGRGIGRAIASALVRAGATVTVLGRTRATLDEAVSAGDAHFAGVADVADQAAVNAAIAEVASRQSIDILIANAGVAESAPFAKSDAALFRRMMDVDFMGVVHAIQAVMPAMKDRPYGRIVAIAQPHRYTRLRDLFDDFSSCFNEADTALVAPVYPAGEEPIEGITAEALVARMRAGGHRDARFIEGPQAIAPIIRDIAKPGDFVVFLGAGNITQWAYALPGELNGYNDPGIAR